MIRRHPSRAIIDLDAYVSNLELVRRLAGGDAALIPVLKANAYGHGLVPLARAALRVQPNMLAVATVEEGIALRTAGITAPILVMVHPHKDAVPFFLEYQLTLTCSDLNMAQELGARAHAANCVAPIHCKIDTGMGRQGFNYDEALAALQYVSRMTHLDLQGIFTHFPCADIPDDKFTHDQIKAFRQLLKQVDKAGFPYEMAHAANSAAVVNYQESILDAVRPGLMTYGVWPTAPDKSAALMKRVLRWETTVVQIRELPAGASIGYGRTYKTTKPVKTAVLPVGYADGYKYQLGNKADVLIRGKRCPVRGSVCMDQIVVDVSEAPDAACGDTATLIGADGDACITPEELARLADTIPYDILTAIGTRVHREYTGAGASGDMGA